MDVAGIAQEQMIRDRISAREAERSSTDKLLAKEDIKEIRELISKDPLNRSELLRLCDLMAGAESKLYNYHENERFHLLLFYTWIRDLMRITEGLFDYIERLNKNKQHTTKSMLSLNNSQRNLQHSLKFLIDVFLLISRTTLSHQGAGFKELLSNKWDMQYSYKDTMPKQQETKRLF